MRAIELLCWIVDDSWCAHAPPRCAIDTRRWPGNPLGRGARVLLIAHGIPIYRRGVRERWEGKIGSIAINDSWYGSRYQVMAAPVILVRIANDVLERDLPASFQLRCLQR